MKAAKGTMNKRARCAIFNSLINQSNKFDSSCLRVNVAPLKQRFNKYLKSLYPGALIVTCENVIMSTVTV